MSSDMAWTVEDSTAGDKLWRETWIVGPPATILWCPAPDTLNRLIPYRFHLILRKYHLIHNRNRLISDRFHLILRKYYLISGRNRLIPNMFHLILRKHHMIYDSNRMIPYRY
uniref:Uncharacterized protein n=1 Tax=Oryza glumipatula TaxID=40148 RepID=A0A0D9ZKM3_9ORYZ